MEKTKWFAVIAILQVIGGGLGLLVSFQYLSDVGNIDAFVVLITMIFIVFYLTSIFAGWLLWKEHPQGITLSMFIQLLQIPQISIPGFVYIFINPLDISLVMRSSSFPVSITEFSFGPDIFFGSSWSFYVGAFEEFLVGFNVLALVLLIFLGRKRRLVSQTSPLTVPLIGLNRVQCPKCEHANYPFRMKCRNCRVNLVEAFRVAHEEKLALEVAGIIQSASMSERAEGHAMRERAEHDVATLLNWASGSNPEISEEE